MVCPGPEPGEVALGLDRPGRRAEGLRECRWPAWWPDRLQACGAKSLCSKTIVVDHEPVKDECGRQLYDADYKPVTKPVLGQVYCCPRCGAVVRNQKGVPVGRKDLTSGAERHAEVLPGQVPQGRLQRRPAQHARRRDHCSGPRPVCSQAGVFRGQLPWAEVGRAGVP